MALTGLSRGDRQEFSLECLCFSAIWGEPAEDVRRLSGVGGRGGDKRGRSAFFFYSETFSQGGSFGLDGLAA